MSTGDENLPVIPETKSEGSGYTKDAAVKDAKVVGKGVAKAVIGLIPFAGSVLVELYDSAEELKKRREEELLRLMVENHGVDISMLKQRLNNDEDLADLVMRGLDSARKASYRQKLKILATVIAGSLDAEHAEHIYARFLFQILDVIEREHIEVLIAIREWPSVDLSQIITNEEMAKVAATRSNIEARVPHLIPIAGALFSSLESNQLIRDQSQGTYFGGLHGGVWEISEMGEKLLDQIQRHSD